MSLSGVLTSLCAVSLCTFAAVLGTGGTYALWNDDAEVAGTTITSGVLDLTVTGGLNSTPWSKLLPGEHHVQFVTIENTGNIPLTLSVLSAQSGGHAGSFELRLELVGPSQACSSPHGGADSLGNSVGFGAMPPASAARLCVDVRLTDTALPGHHADFALTLTGGQ